MSPRSLYRVEDPAELAAFFSDQRAAHIYALADLEEPFWSASDWYRRDDGVVGVVRLPDGEGVATYAVSTRDPAATRALLADIVPALPSGQLVTAPTGASTDLGNRSAVWAAPHIRYELTARESLPDAPSIVPLGLDDLDEVEELYASEPGAAFFLPHMLSLGTFAGVRECGELVAIAGTHVVSEHYGVAAIGGVFTRPDRRGHGLAARTTAGAIARIPEGIDTIGLNVSASNGAARRAYERLGFDAILTYEEYELA